MDTRTPLGPPSPAPRSSALLPLRQIPPSKRPAGLPDVYGWAVVGGDGRRFGVVDDLIVDDQMRVRYLAIDVDDRVFGLTDDLRMLVPVGAVEVDPGSDALRVPEITMPTLLRVPVYRGGAPLRSAYEQAVARAFGAAAHAGASFYAGRLFDERPFRAACERINGRRRALKRAMRWGHTA